LQTDPWSCLATAHVRAFLVSIVVLTASCASPILPNPTSPATPPESTLLPSPLTTETPATAAPSPTGSAPPELPGLIVHLTDFGDTGSFGAGTTILDDGRIIWTDRTGRVIESRLAPSALVKAQAELDSSGVLDRSASYSAKLRPGATPPGHGVGGYEFELVREGRRVVVDTEDPRSFAGEERFWVIPPPMDLLAAVADRLNDPAAWLGPDGFLESKRQYRPDRFLLEIFLYRTGALGTEPDVDDVAWPFGKPIENVGAVYNPGFEGPESRCLLVDATTESMVTAAELAAGVARDAGAWKTSIDYAWSRMDGSVTVQLTQVLPYETGSCGELATTPP
jgi:hypothetical protein